MLERSAKVAKKPEGDEQRQGRQRLDELGVLFFPLSRMAEELALRNVLLLDFQYWLNESKQQCHEEFPAPKLGRNNEEHQGDSQQEKREQRYPEGPSSTRLSFLFLVLGRTICMLLHHGVGIVFRHVNTVSNGG